MQRASAHDILLAAVERNAAEREEVLGEPQAQHAQQVALRTTFFDHVVQTFFGGSEARMFAYLNISPECSTPL